jgi:hypothetical protein
VRLDDDIARRVALLLPSAQGDNATTEEASTDGLVCLADVAMRDVLYLERPFLQRSAFQLLAGKKNAGKGTYLAGLAARFTRGELGERRDVLVVASEDSASIDIKPRLVAAGGDPAHVFIVRRHIVLPDDLDYLAASAARTEAGLVIIDPLGSHIGAKNSDSETVIRDAIGRLNRIADELDCLTFGVRHFSKDITRGALVSVLGSTAWVDVPRAVLGMARTEDGGVLLELLAANRSEIGACDRYERRLVPVEGLTEPLPVLVRVGPSPVSLDVALGTAVPAVGKKEAAKAFVLDYLSAGRAQLDAMKEAGKAQGHAPNTVYEAATELKTEGLVRTSKDGLEGRWWWERTPAETSGTSGTRTLGPGPANPHNDRTSPNTTNTRLRRLEVQSYPQSSDGNRQGEEPTPDFEDEPTLDQALLDPELFAVYVEPYGRLVPDAVPDDPLASEPAGTARPARSARSHAREVGGDDLEPDEVELDEPEEVERLADIARGALTDCLIRNPRDAA